MPQRRRTDIQPLVLQLLRKLGSKWSNAARVGEEPDIEALADLPDLPGDVSIQHFCDFLRGCVVYLHPRPAVTVDLVVFGLDSSSPPILNVLLIKRGRPGTAFEGCWAIPGGFVDEDEDLEVAARRELREETHAEAAYIEQLATFGKPGRDPRGHVVSVAYMALLRTDSVTIQGDDDANEAAWWPVDQLPEDLAFDHAEILATAIKRLRNKAKWEPIGIDLLPLTFSLADLQQLYEVILGRNLDKRNFRRKVLSYDVLVTAGSQRVGGSGRPPELYRFDRDAYEALISDGMGFEV